MIRPLVTVVIPARNEEHWIGGCLACVAEQDYGQHRVEVVVAVDPATTDDTVRVARASLARGGYARAAVVEGADGTSGNLNRALAEARGAIVCRVDARSRIPREYVTRCVEVLDTKHEVAVVGGMQIALPSSGNSWQRGIARALNNRWSMGFSRYRRGASSGAADTVYLGAFRTGELQAVGGWNESFPTNQDFELNRRMRRYGMVWFDSRIRVGYVPRPTVTSLFHQYRRFGAAKSRYWRTAGDGPQRRQAVILAAAPVAAAGAAALWVRGARAQRVALLCGLAGSALAIEVLGGPDEPASPVDHAVAVVAMAATSAGWLSGVWSGLTRARRGAGDRRGFAA